MTLEAQVDHFIKQDSKANNTYWQACWAHGPLRSAGAIARRLQLSRDTPRAATKLVVYAYSNTHTQKGLDGLLGRMLQANLPTEFVEMVGLASRGLRAKAPTNKALQEIKTGGFSTALASVAVAGHLKYWLALRNSNALDLEKPVYRRMLKELGQN